MFAYRLAAALGIVDVHGMVASMTPEQMDGWIAYDRLEPVGVRGLVAQMATMLAMFAASNGVEASEADYTPGLRMDREQTPEQQRAEVLKLKGSP